MGSHLLRFGILFCPGLCVGMREFVSYDPACKHITDAFCCDCGYIFGRYDCIDEHAGLRGIVEPGADVPIHMRGVKVISDEMAATAAALLGHGAADMSEAAARLLPAPPAPWKPGRFVVREDGAEPPAQPAQEAPKPAKLRPASPEVVGGRSGEFLRYLAEDREHGRT